jgi:hypothetical protein
MKKTIFIIFTILIFVPVYRQNINYGGVYAYGTHPDSGRTGVISVFPDSDSMLLFYLELNRGAPSYNSGAIAGQMKVYGPGEADFTMVQKENFINCSINFWFTNDSLYIRTNDLADECGYGYGVFSDGDFKLKDSIRPTFYVNRAGEKKYFSKLKKKSKE